MKFSVKRIFGILTMFAFITAASYESLCAADIIHCVPCEETGHEQKADSTCKTCKQSTDVASVANLAKFSISHDLAHFDYTIAEEVVFTSPEALTQQPQAPPAVSVNSITEKIIASTPVRGPSIVA